jgi:addiction module RelE/StbE family toxin
MRLIKTSSYGRNEKKFFKQHKNLIDKYFKILKQLQNNPFEQSLKTHKLKGNLQEYYACYLTYEYRIVLTIKVIDEEVILMNIGSHDEVY